MLIIRTLHDLERTCALWRQQQHTIALIPTLGALHDAHGHLMHVARSHAHKRIVSIFLNPTQFAPHEDLRQYPHTPEQDIACAKAQAIDALFMPPTDLIYPQDFATSITMPTHTRHFCARYRPHHFPAVLTVVARLLMLVKPDIGVFGEKDYQQLRLIQQLVKDMHMPITILPVPTYRHDDGLAFSSRNAYLDDTQRARAPLLYKTLLTTQRAIQQGQDITKCITHAQQQLRTHGFDPIDYIDLCDGRTLTPTTTRHKDCRLLAAAWLGTTRLIDNVPL
ncbi:MAG: pantoate--beta-alanine ligase [Alphaproteobacteria bacterium GM7ARS4]|nr:pantoate--beta-alanine ligase [Alphaproteobacteria bacterium GM7ARS4]